MRPLLFFLPLCLLAAEKPTALQLIQLAHNPASAQFHEALTAAFSHDDLAKGTAILGQGRQFICAIDTPAAPSS